MKDPYLELMKTVVEATKQWGIAKKEQGFIPTIELFVEEMTEHINKLENAFKETK